MLSNRTPKNLEFDAGHQILRRMLELGRFRHIIAVGKKSGVQLSRIGVGFQEVRHPANGGAGKFRYQLLVLMKKGN